MFEVSAQPPNTPTAHLMRMTAAFAFLQHRKKRSDTRQSDIKHNDAQHK